MKNTLIISLIITIALCGCNMQETKKKKTKEQVVAIDATSRPNTLSKTGA